MTVEEGGKTGAGEGVLYKTTFLELLPYIERGFALEPEKLINFEPGLAFAVDTAIRDLQGEIIKPDYNFPVVREIFLEEKYPEKRIRDFLAKGTKTVKIKVGDGVEKDKAVINRVNTLSGGRLKINLDANRAYTVDEAVLLAGWARNNNVVLFEEPVKGGFSAVKKFRGEANIPVMLDESIQKPEDLDRAISGECFDVLNVKLTRLGGITAAEKYIARCRKAGIKIYLGCSEELDTGTAAVFSLAEKIKHFYAIEGFGRERIDPASGFSYTPGKDSRSLFISREFAGVWKTRYENLLTTIGHLTGF